MKNDTDISPNLGRENQDEEALVVHQFVKKVRNAMSSVNSSLSGTFEEGCEENCVLAPLLATVNMLLYGSSVSVDCRATKSALTICQLIMLNFHEKVPKGDIVRNKKSREPPLPVYLGLTNYGRVRDKKLINELHNIGLAVLSDKSSRINIAIMPYDGLKM